MPRLLIFAPWEKLIIGLGDSSASLIGILQAVQVNPKPGSRDQSPQNITLPMSWVIFTLWHREPGEDVSIGYEQRVALISPMNKVLLESVTAFVMEKESHRIGNTIFGLPVGESGTHMLKLSLRRSDSTAWKEVSSFPLTVTYPRVASLSETQ
jgi:hypothetical protein